MNEKKGKENVPPKEEENHDMTMGMSFGLLAGAGLMAILSAFGKMMWGGAGIGLCLLAGMLIGMNIKKK